MRSCLIYGHDGFDIDVLFNLRSLYRQIGFQVFYARTLVAADLVVVQRPPDRPLRLDPTTPVHIYDYVGTPIGALLSEIEDRANVKIFTSSIDRRGALLAEHPRLEDRLHVMLPPVDPDLWVAKSRGVRRVAPVHIGNHKSYYADHSDAHAEAFLKALEARGAVVWGAGWPAGFATQGTASQHEVSRIYAQSHVAFGMMYPWQRGVTLSGRFWHAPLNGCVLISEPGALVASTPGVLESDYSPAHLETVLSSQRSPEDVAADARAHWAEHFQASAKRVSETMLRGPRRGSLPLTIRHGADNMVRDFVRRHRS